MAHWELTSFVNSVDSQRVPVVSDKSWGEGEEGMPEVRARLMESVHHLILDGGQEIAQYH